MGWIRPRLINKQLRNGVAPKVRTGGSATTGLAAPPPRNNHIYEDIVKSSNPVIKPKGYNVDSIDNMVMQNTEETTRDYPDIIIILNESFYDLNVCTDIQMDRYYLEDFYGIEGANYGYALQPLIGGGTNNTESELLTSNSMQLLPIGSPFNYLDYKSDKNAIGQYLKKLGYNTAGMHCAVPSNYNRHKVYPLLGFDQVIQGKDCFHYYESYGDRPWTDSANYKDMIETWDTLGEGPRFVYMLTYQNHGDYDTNDASLDTIHTLTDFGVLNNKINEFMTSASMSSDAFKELIDYYKGIDRHVIIFMVGDHGPSFISQLPCKEGLSSEEQEMAWHSVPYACWSNYNIEWPENTDYLNVIDIVPFIKQAAGLPLTTYDNTILELHDFAPVRLSNGLYKSIDGKFQLYDSSNADSTNDVYADYLFLEYNLLKGGKEYRKELFEPAE